MDGASLMAGLLELSAVLPHSRYSLTLVKY